MFIAIILKSPSAKLLKFSVLTIYFVILSYLKLLFVFIFITYKSNVLHVYTNLFYKDIIYSLVVVIVIGIYLGLKLVLWKENRIDLQSFQFLFITYGVAGFLFIIVFQNRLLVLKTSRIFETLLFLCVLLISVALIFTGSIIYSKQRERIVTLNIYNKMMADKYHEIEKVYREFAFVNHDIKNHLLVLGEYEEAQEHDKALAYIKKLQIPLSENILRYIKTGNDIIDIILNYKLKDAEKSGISIDVNCEIIQGWEIDDADLCSILGNMLDNAINACSKITTGNKWIKFSMQQKGNVVLLQISNPHTPDKERNSEKQILHGYGLESVKNIVKKYAGDISIINQDNTYVVIINFNLLGNCETC